MQLCPSPVKPVLHVQVKFCLVLRQTASLWQGKGKGGLHMSEGRMRLISSRGGGIFGCKLDKRDSKKRYGPCSKHLYPSFPAGKVLSGHPSQVNWPGSGSRRHRTPRKHGWPRHTSATWPQNLPLNPLGHKQATTCEGRTMNSTADSPQEMNKGKMVAAN